MDSVTARAIDGWLADAVTASNAEVHHRFGPDSANADPEDAPTVRVTAIPAMADPRPTERPAAHRVADAPPEPRWPSAHGRLRTRGFVWLGRLASGADAGADVYRAPHGGGALIIRARRDVVIRTQLADRRVVETRMGQPLDDMTAATSEPDTLLRIGGHAARSVATLPVGEIGLVWRAHLQHIARALQGGVVSPIAALDDVEALWADVDARLAALRPAAERLLAVAVACGFFSVAVVAAALWQAGAGLGAAVGLLALPWTVSLPATHAPTLVAWGLRGRVVVQPASPSAWSGLRLPEALHREA